MEEPSSEFCLNPTQTQDSLVHTIIHYVSEKGPKCCVSCGSALEPWRGLTSMNFHVFILFVVRTYKQVIEHLTPALEHNETHYSIGWNTHFLSTHSPSERNPHPRWLSPQRQLELNKQKKRKEIKFTVLRSLSNKSKWHTDYPINKYKDIFTKKGFWWIYISVNVVFGGKLNPTDWQKQNTIFLSRFLWS